MATSTQVHRQAQNRPAHPSPLNLIFVCDTDSYFNSPSHCLTILNDDYDVFDALFDPEARKETKQVIILIIDADTIVPEDCFREVAREMGEEGSEFVAIIRHESDVMQSRAPLL
ncbi:hypothetical protein GYMLUDRAFT_244548 [Collybiopsis luxurians FD-317 M1]|uniref:Glycosyltransferase 2-like domain-containing protein n=1 Tax=Collybiopsis luxurians FD-317 M1 TaxID=944289 RepID=A0A0D0CVQ9_9AGAR|nr:hypothetical protein GYMLUDRAFT_244548 [Collybiopsis luxurians FD-317 M1]